MQNLEPSSDSMTELVKSFSYEHYLQLRQAYMDAIIEGKRSFIFDNTEWSAKFAYEVLQQLTQHYMKEQSCNRSN